MIAELALPCPKELAVGLRCRKELLILQVTMANCGRRSIGVSVKPRE